MYPFMAAANAAPSGEPTKRRGFISYARKDGKYAALAVRDRLKKELQCEVWRDQDSLRGGASNIKEIERALDWCEFFVAILTPASYESKYCLGEQQLAQKKNKMVIPLVAVKDAPIPVNLVDL